MRLDAQVRLTQVIAQTLTQNLRGDLLLHQKRRPLRLGAGQLMPPEVGEQGIDNFAIVVGQFVVEIATRFKRGVLQGALAEAVDGEDGRLVESLQREVDSIEGLTPEERALFELKARTDATTARLAGWLGLGAAAVDSRLRRAAERARVGTSETRGNS